MAWLDLTSPEEELLRPLLLRIAFARGSRSEILKPVSTEFRLPAAQPRDSAGRLSLPLSDAPPAHSSCAARFVRCML
jgi:hypothetical protein